ncbi:alcohol dehydrogenase catalytic domain-containing protein [Bradyrhizobium jicamae]|uniref:Alcohol dehydrogenase catalytic domain-containing protein n=1 Tax=Bradyrhizobium jicamae TaxID=280332 RepID=A0ABS5FUH4_9BRAD|nr:alcohol dehydrogenase [Bradyrhizobium jicamae]MBR0799936.1 alcohol dehydrogenase catalytic domain-containing protein [Bradyrhizobium jicamae]
MKSSYRAIQVTKPGMLELVERPTPSPSHGEVLISVEACGICGADANDIEGVNPSTQPPRVPGHEIIGRLVALGDGVASIWKPGQRVGIGRLGGHCNECSQCRRGQFQLCQNQPITGVSRDGGYAEMLLALATGLVAIPNELEPEEAAPILCAGIATFNALKKCGAEAGDLVAILGIGGLGHMALQYASKMGFKVVAIGRGNDIEADALGLGAHRYIDSKEEDAAATLKATGGAQAIIATINDPVAIAALLPSLAPQGRLVVLSAGKEPLPVPIGQLVGGERGIVGSITGSPFESEKALQFSLLAGVRPRIETFPLEQAFEAYRRLKSGEAKFRMVLTMEGSRDAHQ